MASSILIEYQYFIGLMSRVFAKGRETGVQSQAESY